MPRPDNLSNPRGRGGGGHLYDAESFGNSAEKLARFFGTPRYLIVQTVIVAVWIAVNVSFAFLRFDKFPFILLNLMFSTQAAYAAPLILLAQNRQADRDKAEVERDREVNARGLAETEYLAREIASIRLAIEQKADRVDVAEPLEQMMAMLERLQAPELPPGD